MVLTPKESGKLIASSTTRIKINQEGIQNLGNVLIEEIKSGKLSVNNFSQTKVHPKDEDSWALDWIFVVDTLNFCFWSPDDRSAWTVDGYTGYFGLCAAINRAMREKVDILNPKYYFKITEKELANILRSDTDVQIPLLAQRVQCLHQVGECLLEKFDGSFRNVVEKAENSAVSLLNLIVSNFSCFKDEATYKGHEVALYKRAQIVVGDVWSCFNNKGIGYFKDIDEITMFADYRVPQSLLYYGVFEYSDELLGILKKNDVLENGSEVEVEIRGCSIHAVELIKEYASKKLDKEHKINSILIDHYLWKYRRDHAKEILKKGLPFHKTYCIYY